MGYRKPETPITPPPATFRMASKPSYGQIAKMANQGNDERSIRRQETVKRQFRTRLAVGAAMLASTVAIAANGNAQGLRNTVGSAFDDIDGVASRVLGDPNNAQQQPSIQTIQHDVNVQKAENRAAEIAANHDH